MKRIITIGREFGAGGGELGRRLAEELGEACWFMLCCVGEFGLSLETMIQSEREGRSIEAGGTDGLKLAHEVWVAEELEAHHLCVLF